MAPLTKDIPKPMVPLCGKPKLEYTLELLPQEIDEVIMVINYLGKQIKEHFGERFNGRKIKYVHQEEINGTGGALHSCKEHLEERFMVMMGDDLYHADDIEKMLGHELAILGKEKKDASRFGMLLIDEDGHFCGIIENKNIGRRKDCKNSNMVNTALYVLDQRFFDYPLVPITDTEYGLPQTLVSMANEHRIKVEKATHWIPLGNVEDIAVAEKQLGLFLSC